MNYPVRSIDNVVRKVRDAKKPGRGCTLLIGAGCSVDAGIPSASGFVQHIQKMDPSAYDLANPKTYAACMDQLDPLDRRDLIADYVDKAKINWTHVCIAALIESGYVDRVLTTNFDLLVVKACALLGEFPAIYDFAASQHFKPAEIPGRAVIYLHGQRTGFVLMNTQEEMEVHSRRLGPVFADAGRGRVWIVAGYSGESDPVFDHLAGVEQFDNGLFWIGFEDREAPSHVRERLLTRGKRAYYVPGYDANSFFVTLTRELGVFPPLFVARPFSHQKRLLGTLTPYQPPGQTSGADVSERARNLIDQAILRYEESESTTASGFSSATSTAPADPGIAAMTALMQGDYAKVLAFQEEYDKTHLVEVTEPLARAYTALGNQHVESARAATPVKSPRLYQLAAEKFQAALNVKQGFYEALLNWGSALADQASRLSGPEVDRLYETAGEKYEAARQAKPDSPGPLKDWGNALGDWANQKSGEEAQRLYDRAVEKYEEALRIDPSDFELFGNWGITLLDRARGASGEEANRLYEQAREKLLAAENLRPGANAYDLACLAALRDDEEGCLEWLTKCREQGSLPSREHVEADEDLEGVRGKKWFKSFLAGSS